MSPNPLITQIDLGGVWHWMIFAGLGVAVWKWMKPWSFPLIVKLLWAYVAVSALFILEAPLIHFGPYTTAYVAQAGQTFAEVIFIPIFTFTFYKYITRSLPYVALFSCLCVWMGWQGFLHAPSFHSALAALLVPYVSIWVAIPIILTIVFHHGATACLILAAQVVVFDLYFKRYRLLIPTMAAVIALIIFHHHGPLLDGAERLEHWQRYMTFWGRDLRQVILGVGAGSFVWTAALLDGFKAPFFLQMHSDWLQILFEYGAVGFALTVGVAVQAIKRSWKNPGDLMGVVGCMVFALTYHPLRYFPSAVLMAWIFCRSLLIIE